jgi:hypothetical protein
VHSVFDYGRTSSTGSETTFFGSRGSFDTTNRPSAENAAIFVETERHSGFSRPRFDRYERPKANWSETPQKFQKVECSITRDVRKFASASGEVLLDVGAYEDFVRGLRCGVAGLEEFAA